MSAQSKGYVLSTLVNVYSKILIKIKNKNDKFLVQKIQKWTKFYSLKNFGLGKMACKVLLGEMQLQAYPMRYCNQFLFKTS